MHWEQQFCACLRLVAWHSMIARLVTALYIIANSLALYLLAYAADTYVIPEPGDRTSFLTAIEGLPIIPQPEVGLVAHNTFAQQNGAPREQKTNAHALQGL